MPVSKPKALIDPQGRAHTYLRLSLTDRCDLGCFYCRPAGGFKLKDSREILSDGEILRLAGIFAGLGVTKIRLTGGEPLIRPGVIELAARLKALPGIRTLGLTTNATRLAALVPDLYRAGIDSVNISLDSLDPERFRRITASRSHARVLEGLKSALGAGFGAVKVNMVVVRGVNDDEVERFAGLAYDNNISVRFIEYMPFAANPWRGERFVSSAEVRGRIARSYDIRPLEESVEAGSVSREWSIAGGKGKLGFISALSEHFCGGCNRLRLTADGSVKLCLYSRAVLNLREPLRNGVTDNRIAALLRRAMLHKPEGHPALEELSGSAGLAMTEIGG